MRREAARTLYSLSPAYQRHLLSKDYQVIVLDNGSTEALDGDFVRSFGPQFSYRYFDTKSVSPAEAVNAGAADATGDFVAVIVDGARMASPGLIGQSQRATQIYQNPFVCALSWHLGPDVQNISMQKGYDSAEEDRLLDSIAWQKNGYRLFDISTLAQSSSQGFLGGIPPECSWFAIRLASFRQLGGFDARFQAPGGGLVNHDFRNRAIERAGMVPVMLLGEGVFHQIHGGVATNVKPQNHPMIEFQAEYRAIHDRELPSPPAPDPVLFGRLPNPTRRFIKGEKTDGNLHPVSISS